MTDSIKLKQNIIFRILNDTKNMFLDKPFISKTLLIAFPVLIQATINLLINMLDTLMIGKLGEVEVGATGLGNRIFFVYVLLVFGIASGVGLLTSQYFGNNDLKNIRKVLGLGILLSLVASFFFTFATIIMPHKLMRIFTDSKEIVDVGASYLNIVGISYPFVAISSLYVASLRSMKLAKLPLIASIVTLIINFTLNYILIFGKFGFSPLGVRGAAIASLIARICEMLLLLISLKITKSPLLDNLKDMFSYNLSLLKQFFKTSAPVILNEFFWSFGVSLYFVVYGRMGKEALAAITLSSSIQDIAFVSIYGLSAATIVILGNELGAGKLERAKLYAKYYYILSFLVAIIFSLVLFALVEIFLPFYNLDNNLFILVKRCILVYVLYFPIKSICMVNIVGILRSGGDTFVCFLLDISSVYMIGVPLAFLSGLVWKLPIYYVYALVLSEEIYKMIVGYIRYKKYKWLKNLNMELES